MPLSVAKFGLEIALYSAYQTARDTGMNDGADSDKIIMDLAEDLTNAIHDYMVQAKVDTNVDSPSGQPDVVGGVTSAAGKGFGIATSLI